MSREKLEPLPDQDKLVEAAFYGPAPHTNRSAVSITPGGIRLAFLEQNGPDAPIHFRNAVMMPFQDAIKLKNLLQTMLADLETQMDFIETEEKAKTDGPEKAK